MWENDSTDRCAGRCRLLGSPATLPLFLQATTAYDVLYFWRHLEIIFTVLFAVLFPRARPSTS